MTKVYILMEETDLSRLGIDKPFFSEGFVDLTKISTIWNECIDDTPCVSVNINGKQLILKMHIDELLSLLKISK